MCTGEPATDVGAQQRESRAQLTNRANQLTDGGRSAGQSVTVDRCFQQQDRLTAFLVNYVDSGSQRSVIPSAISDGWKGRGEGSAGRNGAVAAHRPFVPRSLRLPRHPQMVPACLPSFPRRMRVSCETCLECRRGPSPPPPWRGRPIAHTRKESVLHTTRRDVITTTSAPLHSNKNLVLRTG
jgi:hypothetical protein